MTAGRCTLVCCAFDRERANRAPGRRSLTPLYSSAAATRDAVAGDSTPSTATPGAPEPHLTSPGLGSTVVLGQTSSVTGEDGPVHLGEHGTAVALDTMPAKEERSAGYPTGRDVARGVANVPAAQLPKTPPRRSPFLSVRMRWWDDFLDDVAFAACWGFLGLVAFIVAVRVLGGVA